VKTKKWTLVRSYVIGVDVIRDPFSHIDRLWNLLFLFKSLPMPRQPENPGTCAYCGEITTKRGAIKHLDKCAKRQETLAAAEANSRPVETLWHLCVQDAYDKDFWLDLEMAGSASLDMLDKYLRAIWLE
jgi:hypothetical protein